MKFVLILITAIFVFLGIYTYINQTTEKSVPVPKIFEKKVEVQKTEKVSVVTQEVKEKKNSVKNIAVKSPKVLSKELSEEAENEEMVSSRSIFEGMQDEVADFSNIGEGLTLESIQNSDVSEHEKELMLDDLAAYQSYRGRNNPSISKEEGIKALTKEFN